jgi:hypothetical protein
MKKCVNCGYEGEEILICPVCGGNMEHAETLQEEMKEDLEQYQMDVTADADDVKPEKRAFCRKRSPERNTGSGFWSSGPPDGSLQRLKRPLSVRTQEQDSSAQRSGSAQS